MTTLDRGLSITWYDLPAEGRDEYFSWLHDVYMPEILRRPGILWGAHYAEVKKKVTTATHKPEALVRHTNDPSVPTGSHYMLIFGAECANVFGEPDTNTPGARELETRGKMLALRIGARVNIMAESGRVEGPEARHYRDGMLLAPCINLGSYNTAWQNEDDLLAYYTQMRLPALRVMPGCIRTRNLVSFSGWAKHAVLYEFTSLEARTKNFIGHQEGHPEMAAWSAKMVPKLIHAPGSSNVAVRIWPGPQQAA